MVRSKAPNSSVLTCPPAREKRIISFLRSRGSATSAQIGRLLRKHPATISGYLKALFSQGKISRSRQKQGSNSFFLYQLPSEETQPEVCFVEQEDSPPEDAPITPQTTITTPFLFHSEVDCHKCHRTFTGIAWISAVLGAGKAFIKASLYCPKCYKEK